VLRKTRLLKDTSQRFTILDTMSSILYPGRFTLLLGPPGAGKTTLLNALSGRLHKSPNIDVSNFFPFLLKRKEKTTLLSALSGRLHKSPNIDVSDFFPSLLKRKRKNYTFWRRIVEK